jgi:hypothetical protein
MKTPCVLKTYREVVREHVPMATFTSSFISFLLLSAIVLTLFFLCLSPFNQTTKISSRSSSFFTPNYSIDGKTNHTFDSFQSFSSPILLLPPPNPTFERLQPSPSPSPSPSQGISLITRHERVSLVNNIFFFYLFYVIDLSLCVYFLGRKRHVLMELKQV